MLDIARELARVQDTALQTLVGEGPERRTVQYLLYAALRREQAAFVASEGSRDREAVQILRFARAAEHELGVLVSGHDDELDRARDGEWTLRDLLRHAIAVELRYRAQVLWSAGRSDTDPLEIPADRLPCDRLVPPAPEFAESATGPASRVLDLLAIARHQTDRRLATVSDDSLIRPSIWGSVRIDVRERIHQIAAHLVEVIVQTEKMLGTTGESEAGRIVRRIAYARGMHERATDPARLATLDAALSAIATALRVQRGGPP